METWHPDVRFFEIRAGDGDLRGQFYLDPFARPNKRGGAWMDVCVNRLHTATCDQIPCAYLVCNFSPPVGDQPSLLTHTEVLTLFHECGHGLHHLLTQIDYPAVGGISGVPWDAVELPSQFLENWCWERESLDLISGQVASGEPIPDGLYQRMRAARNFQSAMQMARQLEFALFDFRIHLEYDPARGGRIQEILDQVRDQVAPLKPRPLTALPRVSPTSSVGATRRATTATNGPRSCPPMPSPSSRRRAFWIPPPAAPSANTSWNRGAPARPWTSMWPSGAASPRSTPCSAIAASRSRLDGERQDRSNRGLGSSLDMPPAPG